MDLAQEKRGEYADLKYLTEKRVSITYELPLAEVTHFFGWPRQDSDLGGWMQHDATKYHAIPL